MYGSEEFGGAVSDPSDRIGWFETKKLPLSLPDEAVESMMKLICLTGAERPFVQLYLKWPELESGEALPGNVLTVTTRHLINAIGLSEHQSWSGAITNEDVYQVRSIVSLVHPIRKVEVGLTDPAETLRLEAERLNMHYDWKAIADKNQITVG